MQHPPNDTEHYDQAVQQHMEPMDHQLFRDPLFDMNTAEMSLDLPIDFGADIAHIPHNSPKSSPQDRPAVTTPNSLSDDAIPHSNASAKRGRWAPTGPLDSPSSAHTPEAERPVKRQGSQAGSTASTTNKSAATIESPATGSQLEIKKMTDVKSRACDECRRRKTACYYLNSENAKCFRCQMENIECTFSTRTRNTSQSGGTSGTGANRQGPISQRQILKQGSQFPGPIEDYSQLPGRSLLKKTLSLQHPRSSFSIGQHGLWDQRVLQSIQLDKSNQARISPNLAVRKVGSDSWFMIRNEGGENERASECDEIERLVYPYGSALVNAFFMFFQPEYPVLHEKIFVEKYLRTYRELMPALLGSVYLLGMRWWIHSSELSTVPKPDHIIPKLYDMTLTYFFKSSGGSSLSLVQAGLLLLQCSYSDPRHLSICSVINAAALRLALNRNCLHWKLPRWEINLRMRLSWAIYSQSTWISLFESIPPLIQDSSWYLSALNPDMFDSGSNELNHNGALFIQLNKLSLIVHDMHNLLSSQLFLMYSSESSAQQANAFNANTNVATGSLTMDGSNTANSGTSAQVSRTNSSSGASRSPLRNNTPEEKLTAHTPPKITAETILEIIKPIQLRLHEWHSKLPPSLINVDGQHSTGNFSLRIAYIAAEVTLHRFIIRAVCTGSRTGMLNTEMYRMLRSTAKERLDVALNLLKMLKPQHVQQFWYFAAAQQLAVIGLFAALMYTTSDDDEEARTYQYMLKSYIDTIKVYSDNDVMSNALRILRSSIAGVPGLTF